MIVLLEVDVEEEKDNKIMEELDNKLYMCLLHKWMNAFVEL
jgi:hypothetical protein